MNLPDENREELTAYLFGAATSREVFASPMAAGGYAKWSEGIADALAPLLAGWLAEARAEARSQAVEDSRVIHRGILAQARREALAEGEARVRARVEALADEWERAAAWIRANGYGVSVEDPAALTEAAARRLRAALDADAAETTGGGE